MVVAVLRDEPHVQLLLRIVGWHPRADAHLRARMVLRLADVDRCPEIVVARLDRVLAAARAGDGHGEAGHGQRDGRGAGRNAGSGRSLGSREKGSRHVQYEPTTRSELR